MNNKNYMGCLKISSFLFVMACSFSVYANDSEIDPTIRYLISTPTTLMDKGVFEIERIIKQGNSNSFYISKRTELIKDGIFSGNVYVDPKRIKIYVYFNPDKFQNPKQACRDLLRYTEFVLGFQTGLKRKNYMPEKLSILFGHYGYTAHGDPSNLGNRLLGLINIQAGIVSEKGKHFCHNIGGGGISDGMIE